MRTLHTVAIAMLLFACAGPPDPERYRLTGSGTHWDTAGTDAVLEDLLPRYPAFFASVLDPNRTADPNLRALRDDLEREPPTRANYDALNAIAIGYFELNYRAQSQRGGSRYMGNSFRAAKLLAVPWRAYSEVESAALRNAIVDFFEDAAFGGKLEAIGTAGRLERVVASLAPKEPDAERRARIEQLVRRIRESAGPR